MTFSPDSPELTAYLLGELDPETRAALEAELARSPELAAELTSLSQVLGVVSDAFSTEPAVGLSPEQHQRVMEALSPIPAVPNDSPSAHGGATPSLWAAWTEWLGWRGGFALAGGLAAVAVGLFLIAPKREATQSMAMAMADGLRYQPDWTPPQVATQAVVIPAGLDAAVPPPPAPSGTKLAAATAASSAAGDGPMAPTLAKRYGLMLAPQSSAAAAESKEKLEAPRQFDTAGTAAPQVTRTLSASSDRSRGGLQPSPRPTVGRTLAENENLARAERVWETQQRAATFARAGTPAIQDLSEQSATLTAAPSSATRAKLNLGRQYAYKAQPLATVGQADSFGEAIESTARFGFRGGTPPAADALALRVIEANAPSTAFAPIQDNPFQTVTTAPLSTFGMDVDTGSYSMIRRMLRENSLPPADAVRLEELLNYFSYEYPQPKGDHPLGATVEVAACPWNEAHKLVRIGVKAREVADRERPRSNLVFLLDVSGSMAPETRLPLVKRAMRLLIDRLSPRDTVGIVTYAGEARVALEPVAISDDGRRQVTEVLDGLQAGSGTHGSAGIQNAYAMATNHFIAGGVNRVILCTDGDFNVGVTDQNELLSLIAARAKSGVFLSVLGFGMDNLKDSTLELLADRGNGNYAYIDSFAEARKVLVKQLDGTLVTVAKDAKIQVEFNPARVSRYRLLGYEKRLLRDRDFNDDTKDAGDVGAGHSVTALYEVEPVGGTGAGVDPLRYGAAPATMENRSRGTHVDELLNLKIRYKQPDGQTSRLMEMPVKDADRELAKASTDFKFAASVAGYGMLLRQSPHAGSLTWEQVLRLAEQGQGNDVDGYRAEFIDLARRAQALRGQP